MRIELEWVKKIEVKISKKNNSFFLLSIKYSPNKKNNFHDNKKLKAIKEINVDSAAFEVNMFGHSGNLESVVKPHSAPAKNLEEGLEKLFKKMVGNAKANRLFTALKWVNFPAAVIATFSFSSSKNTFPQSWKTKFVHLLEKSNLLVRSDNNTGFSLMKMLQTTTI